MVEYFALNISTNFAMNFQLILRQIQGKFKVILFHEKF